MLSRTILTRKKYFTVLSPIHAPQTSLWLLGAVLCNDEQVRRDHRRFDQDRLQLVIGPFDAQRVGPRDQPAILLAFGLR